MAFLFWVFSRGRKPEQWLEAQKANLFYPTAANKCFLPWFELGFYPEGSQMFFSFCLSDIPPTWRKTNKNNQKTSTFIQISCHVCVFLANSFKLGCAFTLQHNYEQRVSQYTLNWPNTNNIVVGCRKKVRWTGTDWYRKSAMKIAKIQETTLKRTSQNRRKT